MLNKPRECDGCALCDVGTGFSVPDGTGANGVLIIGEALGEYEKNVGKPFRPEGPGGHVLEQAIKSLGMDRAQFAMWSIVACQPPGYVLTILGQSYEYAAIEHCKTHTRRVVQQFKPRVIVACGPVAVRVLTGLTGKKLRVDDLQGFAIPSPDYPGVRVIPTYDPGTIQRGAWQVFPVLRLALAKAVKLAREGWKEPEFTCIESASPVVVEEMADKLKANPEMELNFDFETDGGEIELDAVKGEDAEEEEERRGGKKAISTQQTITQVNLSIRDGEACAIDFNADTRSAVERILGTPNLKHGHNCFARNTSVWTPLGWRPIHKMKVGDAVYSDAEGVRTVQHITGVVKGLDDRPWVEVRVDGAYNRGVGKWGNPGVICTPDHEWFTPQGKVRADSLHEGVPIYLPRLGSPALIAGCILGDGHITKANRLMSGHTNVGWAKAKADAFGSKLHKTLRAPNGTFNKDTCVFYTLSVQIPAFWRAQYYDARKQKQWVPPDGPRALAILYGDDGCLSKHGSTDGRHNNATLALHKFGPDVETVRKWFERKFGTCTLHNGHVLYMHKDASHKFWEYIAASLHPSMYYKLPDAYKGRYNGWMSAGHLQAGTVISVTSLETQDKHKYCLSVTGTRHSFFTRAGLVSNCWMFDLPVAHHNNLSVNGIVMDSMWMFHHAYPDLPGSYKKVAGDSLKDQGSLASLQFCASFYGFPWPWKHMRLNQGMLYGCYDGIAGRMVYNGARRDLVKLGCWDSYITFVQRLRPILADAERRGIPINRQKLQEFITLLEGKEKQELAKLAPMIPEAFQPAKQKMGLKKEPKDMTGYVKRSFFLLEPEPCGCVKKKRAAKCGECGGRGSTFDARDEVVDCVVCQGRGSTEAITIAREDCPQCDGTGEVKGDVTRWCQLLPFNPDSPAQVKAYALYTGPTPQGYKERHIIPKNSKRKYAMDKETLEHLAKMYKDPVYQTVLAAKAITKMKGTYGEGWLSRTSSTDECVHTQFLFLPATGQLSSIGPNVMNQPSPLRHGELALKFAEAVEAKPGYKIVGLDYKSYHAQTLAHEAKDWDYLRLARLDIHSFLAGRMLRIEGYKQALGWDDDKLGAWLKEIKKKHEKVRNRQAKPCIAEGQMVLTDNGLVPIERVTLAHKVWDGVEWVSHEGVICKGVKEVITYDGLAATPDHDVYTEYGKIQFGSAAHRLARLIRSGDGELPIQIMESHGEDKTYGKKASDFDYLRMRMWQDSSGGPVQTVDIRLRRKRTRHRTTVCIAPSVYPVRSSAFAARRPHTFFVQERADWRANNTTETPKHVARVYDIVNAGPRHRFTVSNRLVHNCILGYGFGMGAARLYASNPDNFSSIHEAQQVFDAFSSAFPNAARYREEAPELAHRQKFLKSPFNCIRWFWNVKGYNFRKKEWTHGLDWDKAIAFRPANNAFCQKKVAMLVCEELGYMERYGFNFDLHDALYFHCKAELVEECVHNVRREMEAPSSVLLMPDGSGFSVAVEVKVGRSMAELQEVK